MLVNKGDRVKKYKNPRTYEVGEVKEVLPFNKVEVELPDGQIVLWATTEIFHAH